MRRSVLSGAISYALAANEAIRPGPITPYSSLLNREAYYRLLGQSVIKARSIGKSLTYGYRYAK